MVYNKIYSIYINRFSNGPKRPESNGNDFCVLTMQKNVNFYMCLAATSRCTRIDS